MCLFVFVRFACFGENTCLWDHGDCRGGSSAAAAATTAAIKEATGVDERKKLHTRRDEEALRRRKFLALPQAPMTMHGNT